MINHRHSWHDPRVLALARSQSVADPEEAIKSLCIALIDETGISTPPFRPEILASFRGIVTIRRIPMKESGRLVPIINGFEIAVNSEHTSEKQNFSINHEICHTFFSEFGTPQTKIDFETGIFNIKEEEEYLCDIGASTLLFNPKSLSPVAMKLGATSVSIIELARQFEGSLEATARAVCDLDLWPCAVIFWEESIKPSQRYLVDQPTFIGFEDIKDRLPKLRVRLSWHSPSFKSIHYFPKHKSAPAGGLVYSCHMSQEPTTGYENIDSPIQQLWMDSAYVPYRKDGNICPRVMTVVTLQEKPLG